MRSRRCALGTMLVRQLAVATLSCACVGMPVGKAAISVHGRVAGHEIDRIFGRLACEHAGWVNVYDGRGNVLVFAPQHWRPAIGIASMQPLSGSEDVLQERSNAGWINADFTRGFSIHALAGRTRVTTVTTTEVSGNIEWTMGFPNDSGRLSVVGAFRAVRGCPRARRPLTRVAADKLAGGR
jgi:hypothetical protein